MPTDAVSIRILTDSGLRAFRIAALDRYTDPEVSRADQVRASHQLLAAQDEAARRRGAS